MFFVSKLLRILMTLLNFHRIHVPSQVSGRMAAVRCVVLQISGCSMKIAWIRPWGLTSLFPHEMAPGFGL